MYFGIIYRTKVVFSLNFTTDNLQRTRTAIFLLKVGEKTVEKFNFGIKNTPGKLEFFCLILIFQSNRLSYCPWILLVRLSSCTDKGHFCFEQFQMFIYFHIRHFFRFSVLFEFQNCLIRPDTLLKMYLLNVAIGSTLDRKGAAGRTCQQTTERLHRHRRNSVSHRYESFSIIFHRRIFVAIVCFTVFRFWSHVTWTELEVRIEMKKDWKGRKRNTVRTD